jgi:glycosyltransferase involved in cell wall biosynthesis
MKKKKIFVLNIPAFYKINLLNSLSKHIEVEVAFLNSDRIGRRDDFFNFSDDFKTFNFSINRLQKIKELFRVSHKSKDEEIILGGWDRIEFWFLAFFSNRMKNSLILETSILDFKKFSFLKFYIKKIFLSRIAKVYVSGTPHKELLLFLDYAGEIVITQGVGLINYSLVVDKIFTEKTRNFLFIGRIDEIKGFETLLKAFTLRPNFNLTIAGEGEYIIPNDMENVKAVGYVNQDKLSDLFINHDVLILPSLVEPWGLVVEEAIYNKLPVIISDRVGCYLDIVLENHLGIVHKSNSVESIINALDFMANDTNYKFYLDNVNFYDTIKKDLMQTNAFIG